MLKQLRADGTKIPKASQHRPSTPPMDANTRRDHDDRDHSGGRGDTGGRGNRDPRRQGGRGKVAFDKSIYSGKGTQCLTDIVTHLSCNCGESDINSSYRQCLVSMRSSTTYFTALTLFDTGAYTSFVNREVAKWLEQQDDGEPSPKISRHDQPTATVGLAGTVLSSNIYGTVVFDLTFFNEVTKSDNVLRGITATVASK